MRTRDFGRSTDAALGSATAACRQPAASVRLVFFGTPTDAVPALARAARRGARDRARRHATRPPTRPGDRAGPEPGEGGRGRRSGCRCSRPTGPARSSTTSPRAAPTSAWSSRSASSSPRRCSTAVPARVRERALLVAAALAGRGAGRAGDARGRHRDRRLHHGARGRASTPARCTPASDCPIGSHETAGELRARLVDRSAPSCWSRPSPRCPRPRPVPQVRRADLRRQAHGRGVRARLGAARGRPRPHRARAATRAPVRGPPTTAAGSRSGGRGRCRRASTRRPAPCSATPGSRPATARSS